MTPASPAIRPAPPAPPAPGVHQNVPFETYRAWPAVNQSLLGVLIEQSPEHCRHAEQNPEPDTEALLVGRAFHTLVLEPGTFATSFAIAGQCSATKAKGDACTNPGKVLVGGQWFCGVHAKGEPDPECRSILTAEQFSTIQAMHDRLLAHPRAAEFIDCGADNELSLCWRDKETGLLCKARIDLYRALAGAIGDLKTTEDASIRAFKYAIRKYGYHRQGAFYLAGAAACGLDADTFAILAVEKSAPHGVSTLVLGEQMLSEGHEQIRKAMITYAECKQSGVWPGYTTGFTPIDFES